MHDLEGVSQTLNLLNYPGFAVREGTIVYVNEAAKNRFFECGKNICDLLLTGQEEYSAFTDGCLYLSLCVCGCIYDAAILKMGDFHLFLIEHAPSHSELQALALASQQLRIPLADILAATDSLFSNPDAEVTQAQKQNISQINRGIYQLLRLVGNMSDAARYLENSQSDMTAENISAIIEEVMEKSTALLADADLTLRFKTTQQPVFAPANKEQLERAIYNLVSNAAKFSAAGSVIDASLNIKNDLMYFTVSNSGEGIAKDIRGNIFNRFLRQPSLEDHRFGTGLGMVIVHSAATAHGGTVLVEHPATGGTKVTLTVKLNRNGKAIVRSSVFSVDYAGGHDHGLLELSDILPESVFDKYL
jgi:two-component sensor histidine kinase